MSSPGSFLGSFLGPGGSELLNDYYLSPGGANALGSFLGPGGPNFLNQHFGPPNAQPGPPMPPGSQLAQAQPQQPGQVPLPQMPDLPPISTGSSALNLGQALANAPQQSTGASNANIGTSMHNTFAGTPLEIVQGDQHAFTYPSGARVGFDRYGDLNTPNPLRNIDQTATNIRRQFQGDLSIPLDQANAMAAHHIGGLYNGIIPEWMRSQLGTDELRLRQQQAQGYNGIPGSIFNNAMETNARFSPEGQSNQFWNQQINNLLASGQASNVAQAIQMLDQAGIHRPNFLPPIVPREGGGGTPVTETLPVRIQGALQRLLHAFPQVGNNPNNRQINPGDTALINQGINNYLSQFTPQELQTNYQQIVGALSGSQLGTQNVQNWYRTPLPGMPWRLSPAQEIHLRNREVLRRLHGHALGETLMGLPGRTSQDADRWSAGSYAPNELLP